MKCGISVRRDGTMAIENMVDRHQGGREMCDAVTLVKEEAKSLAA